MHSLDIQMDERKLVLVVEDEILVRYLMSEELVELGMQVIEASTADEAFPYLAIAGAVDLIFSDVHMPGRTDGLELARTVQREFPGVPVLLTSGLMRPQDIPDGIRLIPKPYNVVTVAERILAILDAR